jgi:hypothetical protein
LCVVEPTPVSNNGSSPVPDGRRLVPNQACVSVHPNTFSDIAIVPGPPISTTQSTPRPLVSPRTGSSQSGVSR